ncbi:hypothetical protein [Acuticoccus sediminis]|uniref:hypothetical protein n=1 Tax=Acuticoccus sediminis TaxID=2184697 RepID=UPI001CFF0C3A|nr:hypothetical protein [Acuticoccus sediminis]
MQTVVLIIGALSLANSAAVIGLALVRQRDASRSREVAARSIRAVFAEYDNQLAGGSLLARVQSARSEGL